jgi:DNA primase
MAKISPVSIKYMIHANFTAEGALEKPDIIGAIFGQTEGLLGSELEMRELQKEGKIGRIEVDLERRDKKTVGRINIPTALDQSETTLIAAAVETIERIGPSDAQIEVERIEDVRGSKRDYIIERAKKLMGEIHGKTDSREISKEIKDFTRTSEIQEYGEEKLPAGDLSGNEVIVVEGRADVLNLMRNGIKNVIAMNGTKLPEAVRALSNEKEMTLFVDGDRGGKLIARNVVDNARIKFIAVAPDGKEVEELNGKEALICLRKKVPVGEFFHGGRFSNGSFEKKLDEIKKEVKEEVLESAELNTDQKEALKIIADSNKNTNKAIILDNQLEKIKEVSAKGLGSALKRIDGAYALVIDGTATPLIINVAEDVGVKVIVASNFSVTSSKINLLSL